MAKNTRTLFMEDHSNNGERMQFICTPSNREMAPLNSRPFGRDHLTDEERAELEELGLWDATTEDGQPLILGVLNGRFGSGGIVTLNRTLFPDDEFTEACRKKRGEIEAWRQSCKAGVPSNAVMGESGHPDWGSKYDKAVVFLSLDVVKDETYDRVCHAVGRVAVLNTEAGRKIAAVRKVGGRIGSSLRGYGEGRYTTLDRESPWWEPNPKWHGEDVILVREFEFDRDPFDMVDDPATPGCWMESVQGDTNNEESDMKLDENGNPVTEETAPTAADTTEDAHEEGVNEDGGKQAEETSDENIEAGSEDVGVDETDEGGDSPDAGDDGQAEGVDETHTVTHDISEEVMVAVKDAVAEAVAKKDAVIERQREEIDNLKREAAELKTRCVEQAKDIKSVGASNAKLEADVSMLTESRDRLTEQVAAQAAELKAFANLKREQARDKAVSDFIAEQKWNPTHPRAARFRQKVETMPGWKLVGPDQAREFCEYHLNIEQSEKSTPPAEGFKSNVTGGSKHPVVSNLG